MPSRFFALYELVPVLHCRITFGKFLPYFNFFRMSIRKTVTDYSHTHPRLIS